MRGGSQTSADWMCTLPLLWGLLSFLTNYVPNIGFVIGVAVWRALGMADTYAPAGGLIGAIFLFMLSFILLRLSIMIFTAVQGVVMLLGGLLSGMTSGSGLIPM